jgi:hypothetical protein
MTPKAFRDGKKIKVIKAKYSRRYARGRKAFRLQKIK